MRQLLAAALVFALVAMNGVVQAADKADPTGTWKWSVEMRGQTREMTLILKLEGDKLTGAMLGRDGQETAIQDAKHKDGDVSFSVVRERNGQKMTAKYSGKLNGDVIKGKIETERDGQTRSRDWEAKRATQPKPAAAASASPAGTWDLTAEINGEKHEVTLKLKQEGDKLSGTIEGSDGQPRALKDVKYKDGDLAFTVVLERNGEDMPLKANAKVTGDTMKGKTTFKLEGEERTMNWEAKRAKPAKTEKPAEPAKSDKADNPTGNWKLSIDINGETRELSLKLKLEGDKLTGTLGDGKRQMQLKDGKFKDGEVTFTVVRESDGDSMNIKNSAKLTGDTMKGKADVEDQGMTLPWEAKRVKE